MQSFNGEKLKQYFPSITDVQLNTFSELFFLYHYWNEKINLISQKDIDNLLTRHILHSLAIAKIFQFQTGSTIVDVGSGGGFPGIPLAILFPETHFTLVDSIGKKVRLVKETCGALGLQNVKAIHERVEKLETRADFVVSRAVTAFPELYRWTSGLLRPGLGENHNGLIALKGGDLKAELAPFKSRVELYPISGWFHESFFSTKTIVYLKK